MEHLWAPWRMEYIQKEKDGESEPCIFCSRIKQTEDEKNLILFRSNHAFIIMNRFPYNNGHLMVVPIRHVGDILELYPEEKTELFELLQRSVKALTTVMQPDGFNIGMNLGRIAGAGVLDHLHFHVVPRWNGDTNFMPVISDTKVISESLNQSYKKLSDILNQ
ncbi:MAG: HIT domain-containing protein [Calditrichaeota bacterium]|nr:HIT domain-containing protein [Calditrichota bacterium]RQV93137.1 MAG: HIT domain-containing protein [bacterium]RQW04494.1 MAG: HIT domain-containing protein [Calditrichota bacterium]